MDGISVRPKCNKPDCQGYHGSKTRCWFAPPHRGMNKRYPGHPGRSSIQNRIKSELPSRRPKPHCRVPQLSPNRRKPKFPETAPARGASRLRSPDSQPRSPAKSSRRSRTRSTPPELPRPEGTKLFRDPVPDPTHAATPTVPSPTDPTLSTTLPPILEGLQDETTHTPNTEKSHGSSAMDIDAGTKLPEGTLR